MNERSPAMVVMAARAVALPVNVPDRGEAGLVARRCICRNVVVVAVVVRYNAVRGQGRLQ